MLNDDVIGVPVIRTDFSDEPVWMAVYAALQVPDVETGYQADVTCHSDRRFAGLDMTQITESLSSEPHGFVFIVDSTTLTHPEHPILVVDLRDNPGRSFRVIPSEIAAVEANLSLANLDFADFADHAAATWPDGIHRGFRQT